MLPSPNNTQRRGEAERVAPFSEGASAGGCLRRLDNYMGKGNETTTDETSGLWCVLLDDVTYSVQSERWVSTQRVLHGRSILAFTFVRCFVWFTVVV